MKSFPAKSLLSCAIVLALLQGCGGGGGGGGGDEKSGSTPPPSGSPSETPLLPAAPAPSIAFAPKQLRFSWAVVGGATFYRVLEDANGSGTFAQVGGDLTTGNFSRDISVHNFNWSAARYQVQACNNNGCTTSATLNASSGVLQAIGYFKASNTGSGDTFGWAIALSDDGNTLAVGAPYEDSASATDQNSNAATDSGAVYVFVKSGGGWVQQAYLKAQTVVAGANFGGSVALSSNGNTLAVGATFENSGAGGAYVFTRSGTTWSSQPTRLQASNAYTNALFGWSVALNDAGDTLAVGSPGEANSASTINSTNHTASNAGAVYTYKLSGSWGSEAYLKATGVAADDSFGSSVALSGSGTTLAVGAPQKSSGVGKVFVYTNSGSWSAATTVAAANSVAGDNFGATVVLNATGDTLAIGAPYRASNGANSGAAYVFKKGTSWNQEGYLVAANTETDDDFGVSLALSGDGNTLAVGAIGEKSAATGINGNTADNSKDGVGAVYLFKRSGATWPTQSTYVKPSTSTVGNEFGTAIGLSADAGTLAISGAFEQSNATGINGTQSNTSAVDAGAVWLF